MSLNVARSELKLGLGANPHNLGRYFTLSSTFQVCTYLTPVSMISSIYLTALSRLRTDVRKSKSSWYCRAAKTLAEINPRPAVEEENM